MHRDTAASFGIEYIAQEILNMITDKSISHNMLITQDNESIISGFYCIDSIEYMLAGKTLLDYTNVFFWMIIKRMIIKRMTKEYISIITMNMVEEESVDFRLREIDETRNYLLDEIKHNNLMREKYKKRFEYLN